MSCYLLELTSATRLPDVWHTEVGEAEYHVTIHKPGGTPSPPPSNISCNPNSFPVQFCPSGVPCPKCGKPSCVCPKWAHVAAALED